MHDASRDRNLSSGTNFLLLFGQHSRQPNGIEKENVTSSDDILQTIQMFNRQLIVFQHVPSTNHGATVLHESNSFEVDPNDLHRETVIHLEEIIARLFSLVFRETSRTRVKLDAHVE